MKWLILTFACIILWGITDILYKKSSNYNDPLSQYKTFVWTSFEEILILKKQMQDELDSQFGNCIVNIIVGED